MKSTLYLCPTQMTVLRRECTDEQVLFETAVAAIKGCRLAMEEAFSANGNHLSPRCLTCIGKLE